VDLQELAKYRGHECGVWPKTKLLSHTLGCVIWGPGDISLGEAKQRRLYTS